MVTVNGGPRRYDSTGRQAQARRSREVVLAVAQRQFLDAGYATTTIAAIAAEAGVSVETIHKAFGGKAGLVRAIYDGALQGQGPVSAYERSDQMRERETDPRTIMCEWGRLTTQVAAQLTPIRLLIRAAAATDAEIAGVLRASDNERLERTRHHAEFLMRRGYLRAGVTVGRATDILYTCSSLEIFEVVVLQRGWSLPEFAEFITDFMTSALLE